MAVRLLDTEGMQGVNKFKDEVEHLAALRHPHVVRIVAKCDSKRALVMEHIAGGSLQAALDEDRIPWYDRVRVLMQASAGLQFLHSQQPPILHRDIKPSNVLLAADGSAMLADVGLSKSTNAAAFRVTTEVCRKGSLQYQCGEYEATGRFTAASDVYSFGIMMAVLVTGRWAADGPAHSKCLYGSDLVVISCCQVASD